MYRLQFKATKPTMQERGRRGSAVPVPDGSASQNIWHYHQFYLATIASHGGARSVRELRRVPAHYRERFTARLQADKRGEFRCVHNC